MTFILFLAMMTFLFMAFDSAMKREWGNVIMLAALSLDALFLSWVFWPS